MSVTTAFGNFFYEMFSIVQDIKNPEERERKIHKFLLTVEKILLCLKKNLSFVV